MKQRVGSQLAPITLPSLSLRNDVFGENFPRGWGVIFGCKRCPASLEPCPCIVKGGSQNLHFLGEECPVGKRLDKAVHWQPSAARPGLPQLEHSLQGI